MHSFLKSRWLTSCGAVFAGQLRSRERREIRTCLPRYLERRARLHWPAFFRQHAFDDHRRVRHFQCRPVEHRGLHLHGLIPHFSHRRTDETYEGEPGALLILLSDPSWATFGGPAPYSAGFFTISFRGGGVNSVFDASTAAFQAGDPSPTTFYDYQYNFTFTGQEPLTVLLSGGQLALYNNSLSDVTAAIFPVPELSTWAMMAFGLAGFGMAGRLRGWRNQSRANCPRSARRLRSDQVGSETGGLGNLTLARICSAWTVARAAGKKPSTIRCASPCTRPQAAMAA
jgi:hypothetical protein